MQLKTLEKESLPNPRWVTRKEITNIREERNEMGSENKPTKQINKMKNWVFGNINKINKYLAGLDKKK